jgi:hypothetical protein
VARWGLRAVVSFAVAAGTAAQAQATYPAKPVKLVVCPRRPDPRRCRRRLHLPRRGGARGPPWMWTLLYGYREDARDMGWLCPPPCQIYSAHENDAGVTAVLQKAP